MSKMANHIKRVKTTTGNEQIDYNALANLPSSDPSLSIDGGFADAFIVGAELDYLENNKANAIIEHKEGDFIYLTDSANAQLQELHIMGKTVKSNGLFNTVPVVYVSGGNLLPYPYDNSTITQNGITFTDNGDGSIHVSGTATADANYILYNDNTITNAKYLSGCNSEDCSLIVSDGTVSGQVVNNSGYTLINGINVKQAFIKVNRGVTVDTVICPMLSYSEIKYERYKQLDVYDVFDGVLRGVPVIENGNYTEDGQMWICDEINCNNALHIQRVGVIDSYSNETINTPYLSSGEGLVEGATVYYVLDAPVETDLELYIFGTYCPTTIISGDAYLMVDYVADVKNYIAQNYVSKELFNDFVVRFAKLEEDFGDAMNKIQ